MSFTCLEHYQESGNTWKITCHSNHSEVAPALQSELIFCPATLCLKCSVTAP